MSQPEQSTPTKHIHLNLPLDSQQKPEWTYVKKKLTPLTITISDHSKLNRYFSHKSLQKYIRYLLTQTCPNPMWLAIKRQSQINHIYYIDIEIEDYLYENLLQERKQLQFLSQLINIQNKGIFKQTRINRNFWDYLFIYDQESKQNDQNLLINSKIQDQLQQINKKKNNKITQEIYKKYMMNVLTCVEMRQNLYPDLGLFLYKDYHKIYSNQEGKEKVLNESQTFDKNLILVIDCEMVSTGMGFELARCTIINYEEQTIFDEFFMPNNSIINYNTEFSGITEAILKDVNNTIQNTLHPFLTNIITPSTILIGHSLQNDFNAMKFTHNKVVDTSVLFKRKNGGKMKLKHLAEKILKRKIQDLTHDSKEDCLATLHLARLRVQNGHFFTSGQMAKEYHLLRDLVKCSKSALLIDHDVDKFRSNISLHFQKTSFGETPSRICEIMAKYSNSTQVAVPKIIFTRFQKPLSAEWEQYYQQIDDSLRNLYQKIPEGSVLLLNHQVNEKIKILPFQKSESAIKTRPFVAVLTKSS